MVTTARSFQHILITGASAGIGASLAAIYAAPNTALFLSGRNSEGLADVVTRCRQRGARINTCVIDVTDQAAMAEWIREADREAPLDLVIANAGISGGTSDRQGEEDQARQIVATNILGVMNTVFPALPLLRERRHGTIGIVSSLASFRGLPGSGAYGASKAAIRVWAETLDLENAPFNLRVVAICPGFVTTRMTARNTFHMLGLMDADRAATIIRDGLDRGSRRIAFPFLTRSLVGLLTLMPLGWSRRLLLRS